MHICQIGDKNSFGNFLEFQDHLVLFKQARQVLHFAIHNP